MPLAEPQLRRGHPFPWPGYPLVQDGETTSAGKPAWVPWTPAKRERLPLQGKSTGQAIPPTFALSYPDMPVVTGRAFVNLDFSRAHAVAAAAGDAFAHCLSRAFRAVRDFLST